MEELPWQREQHRQSLYKKEHIKNKTCVVGAKRYTECVVLGDIGKEGDGQSVQGPEIPLLLPMVTTWIYIGHYFSWLTPAVSQRKMKKKLYFTLLSPLILHYH